MTGGSGQTGTHWGMWFGGVTSLLGVQPPVEGLEKSLVLMVTVSTRYTSYPHEVTTHGAAFNVKLSYVIVVCCRVTVTTRLTLA
jgi:hypothetical protein